MSKVRSQTVPVISLLVQICLLLVSPAIGERYEDPLGEGVNARQGKIFNLPLWQGVEKGLKDTVDIVARVSGNLEVAFDQISDNLGDNLSSLADKIERRVEDVMPGYLRRDALMDTPLSDVPFDADSGEGVDDGLEDFYPDKEDSLEGKESQLTKVYRPFLFGRPDASGLPVQRPGGSGGLRFGMNNFNPFANFGQRNIFSFFNRRKNWWQGQNVCMDREEIDETESTTKNNTQEIGFEIETTEVVDGEIAESLAEKVEVTVKSEGKVEVAEDAEVDGTSPSPSGFSLFSGFQMSSCTDTEEKYTCVTRTSQRGLHKTVKVTHRCCHGFVRDGSGCTKIDLSPIPETLEKLSDTSDFLSLVKAANLVDLLTSSNLTLFVPSDEAIQEYTADLEEQNEIHNSVDGTRKNNNNNLLRRRRETHHLEPVVLGHITAGFVYAGDFVDEQVLPSLNKGSPLRINTYSGHPATVTVNCARVVKANQHSLNGVVHTVDQVLMPVVESLAQIVTTDPQFTILKKLLTKTDILDQLEQEGQITFFAPTDAAFRRLNPLTLESLIEGSSCLDAVLKQHLLSNTICSSAIQGKMKTMNMLDDFVVVERNEDDKLFVEDAQIVARDIVATNGVMHIIDDVLLPDEAKSVSEVLEMHNLTKFLDLLTSADLKDDLNAREGVTVFAPSNNAFDHLTKEEFEALKSDKSALQRRLRYHVSSAALRSSDVTNNHLVETDAGVPLRINLYSSVPLLSGIFRSSRGPPMRLTAGCSRISVVDSRACGGMVHVVESLMEVPKESVFEALQEPQYSIFNQMVQDTGLSSSLSLTSGGPFTLLVPSDHAFKTLPEAELEHIMADGDLKEKIVKRHILREHICCSGVNANNWLFMDRKRTLDGSQIHIRRSSSGRLMAGPARIIECGAPAGNGIVHTVNRMVMDDREISQLTDGQVDTSSRDRTFPMSRFGNIFVF